MKKVLFVVLIWQGLSAQYSIEWSKGIRIYSQFTNWVNLEIDSAENLYLATKGQNVYSSGYKSMLFKISSSGNLLFRDSVEQINVFQLYENNLYSLAYSLLKRDLSITQIWKKNLVWFDSQNYYGENGIIQNKYLYTSPPFDYLLKYDLHGNQIWLKSVSENANNTSVTIMKICGAKDFIYLCTAFVGAEQGGRVLKYDTLGNQIWKVPCGSAENMKTDSAGNVYLINWNNVTKINSEGQMEWSTSVDSVYFKNCAVYDDTLYACGGVITDNQPNPNWDLKKAAYCKMSVQTGDVYSTYSYRIFPGTSYSEAYTQIAKTGNAIYFAGTRSDAQMVALHFVTKLSIQSPAGLLQNFSNSNLLNIFPNPTGRAITLSYKGQAQELKVEVKNALGQSIYSSTLYPVSDSFSENFDLGQQSKGVYFIEVSGNGVIERRKIVVE